MINTSNFYEKYKDLLEKESDLYGDKPPSFLFPILSTIFSYLMEEDPNKAISKLDVKLRKPMCKIIKLIGPMFLPGKHVIENKKQLEDSSSKEKDTIVLPKEPVIWAPNHCFQEDALSSLMTAQRSAYVLIGNPARVYNDIEGIPALINGTILVNRKNKRSRRASVKKCERVLELGSDLIMFPEGVRNKTPNALSLNLYSGVYNIAKEKNVKIIPVIHYKNDFLETTKNQIIHTVIDDPIDCSNLTKEETLLKIKDSYAYWTYLMMEKYGQSTREKELNGEIESEKVWEEKLNNRQLKRYNLELESSSTYYSSSEKEYYKALEDIAALDITKDNIKVVEDAKKLIKSNFQRRY